MKANQTSVWTQWFYTENQSKQNWFEHEIQNRFETKIQNQKYEQKIEKT